MKRLIYLCSLSALMACKPTEKVVYVPKTHNIVTEIVTHDTMIVTQIPEHYAEVSTFDTLSELANPYAYSKAVVSGGVLSHSLGTRGEVEKEIIIEEKIITMTDSIPYKVEVPVYIEKELRWWQTALMWVGVLSIILTAALIILKFRKP